LAADNVVPLDYELWQLDSSADVQLIKDINSGGSSFPYQFVEFNGKYYFSVSDGINGSELWSTDGTTSGTEMLIDIVNGPGNSTPYFMNVLGNQLYFAASDAGSKLWKTDGTKTGTMQVTKQGTGFVFPILQ
jgi:ELWxxDGT repeat protein